MKAVIVTGGQPPSKQLLQSQLAGAGLLIGVDGAADVLRSYGVQPDLLIGDFDTASPEAVADFEARGVRVVRLNPEKDETDTQAALDYALGQGASQIIMLGALGMRIDHALANIAMLQRAHTAGAAARIIDGASELSVAAGHYDIAGKAGQTVSILPLGADIRVTASGLQYPLNDLLLTQRDSRGISNVMLGSVAHVAVEGGRALIVISHAGD